MPEQIQVKSSSEVELDALGLTDREAIHEVLRLLKSIDARLAVIADSTSQSTYR
jgi:hypothetical protein